MTARLLVAFMLLSVASASAEVRQTIHVHSGVCDDTPHWNIPVLTNPLTVPVQIVGTRITLRGLGEQWGYVTHGQTGMWFVFNSLVSPPEPIYKHVTMVPPAPVYLGVGESMFMHHYCHRPNFYDVYTLIDWVAP